MFPVFFLQIEYFIVDISFQFYVISYMTLGILCNSTQHPNQQQFPNLILVIHSFCVSTMIHMMARLKIIAHTLRHTKITAQSKNVVNTCICETARLIEINNVLEDLLNTSFLIRYAAETLAICCIVYITLLVNHRLIKKHCTLTTIPF